MTYDEHSEILNRAIELRELYYETDDSKEPGEYFAFTRYGGGKAVEVSAGVWWALKAMSCGIGIYEELRGKGR